MSTYDYDLITIGAGSGGVSASRYAASMDARVAICEAGRVGGTCVLRGCVPKKIFMYSAQFADAFADAGGYGWQLPQAPVFELSRLTAAKNVEIDRLELEYRRALAASGAKLLSGRAEVLDPHTVQINGEKLTAQRLLIATGGSPNRPDIPGIELAVTSTEMLELTAPPRRLLILGSGYIGVEFAGIYHSFGSAVKLAYRGELPLRGFDGDLRKRLAKAMEDRGIELHRGFHPVRLERVGDEYICHGNDGLQLHADLVLNAMGRSPNTANLGLEQAGVALDPQTSAVKVDAYSRSSVPSIFAVGDVTDRLNLTPVAIAEGRAFVDTEFGGVPRSVNHATVASAVFSQPPLGHIGLSEEQAVQDGHRIQVFEADFRPMRNVLPGRNERSYMKLVVDADSNKVLGLHMIGTDAPEIVQGLAVAVTMGASKRDFDATVAVHPTMAEEFVLMRKPRA
ncbi:glutathione-disulfide reductase [Nevskia soli]|uniref:glutathione-disulfide reductase n=1 Tax=Nevskia soli TaxID=418856 RepID=UPI0004A717FE|nr:glutathione-disulfide reductase [Nevskia soli]